MEASESSWQKGREKAARVHCNKHEISRNNNDDARSLDFVMRKIRKSDQEVSGVTFLCVTAVELPLRVYAATVGGFLHDPHRKTGDLKTKQVMYLILQEEW